jgi:hypothetical protein
MAKKPGEPTLKIVTSSTPTGMQPPRKLGQHGLVLWRTIMSEYAIEDSGGIEILLQLCTALDRAEAQRAIIDHDGESVVVKGIPRAHPLPREELANRAFICRGLQRLGLNIEAIKPIGRPAGRYGA